MKEGTIEEKNNGYVVFKWNIQRLASPTHLFQQQALTIFKHTVNSFSSTSGICFMMSSPRNMTSYEDFAT